MTTSFTPRFPSPLLRGLAWTGAGGMVVGGTLRLAQLSAALDPDHPLAEQPLDGAALALAVMFAGFVVASWLAGRARRITLWFIVAVALTARLSLWTSSLIQSDDAYRYIVDGHALLAGDNPYRLAPETLLSAPPAWATTPAARAIVERVNHPHVPTIYPPLAQWIFAAAAATRPWSIRGPRGVFLALDILTLTLLAWRVLRVGARPGWLVHYAWNPIVIKEIANSAHLDSLPAFLIVGLVVWCWAPTRPAAIVLDGLVTGTLLGLAVTAKLYPLILLPVVLAWALRGPHGVRRVGGMVTALAGVIAIGYLPFVSVGWLQLTAGLRTYSEHWVNNPGAYAVLDALSAHPRWWAHGLTAAWAVLCALWLWRRPASPGGLLGPARATLLVWLLLQPACFPWYAVPILALGTLRPTAWSVVLSGAFILFYVALHLEHHPESVWPAPWATAALHATVWAAWVGGAGLLFAIERRVQ